MTTINITTTTTTKKPSSRRRHHRRNLLTIKPQRINEENQHDQKQPQSLTILSHHYNHHRHHQSPYYYNIIILLLTIVVTILLPTATTKISIVVDATKAYPIGCANKPPSYYDYERLYPWPPPLRLRRSPDDFYLVTRLGCGKFSDVFEAVDVTSSSGSSIPASLSSSEETFKKTKKMMFNSDNNREMMTRGQDGVIRKGEEEEMEMEDDGIDPQSLVVIKCLKPVAPRKIRRELLVLSHASQLPNLARLRGVVIFDSPSSGSSSSSQQQQRSSSSSSMFNPQRMPALVLEHAGRHARWFCHGRGRDITTANKNNNDDGDDDSRPLSLYEIKYYTYHLLIALDSLHSRGIMHRDVKPRNVLITRSSSSSSCSTTSNDKNDDDNQRQRQRQRRKKSLTLIDLGLADFYHPGQSYNVRVASRHYKAPELLVNDSLYGYAVDLWGVGCILIGLLTRREPFFRGRDNVDQLAKIVSVLGTRELEEYLEGRGLMRQQQWWWWDGDDDDRRMMSGGGSKARGDIREESVVTTKTPTMPRERREWKEFVKEKDAAAEELLDEDGLDLVNGLLVYDHEKRWNAREAMRHKFFDDVRDEVELDCIMLEKQFDGPIHWK